MPLYRVLIPFARRRHGNRKNHDEGTVIRLGPREARRMVAAGVIELIREEPKIESAELPEPEMAVKRVPKPREAKPRPARRKRA